MLYPCPLHAVVKQHKQRGCQDAHAQKDKRTLEDRSRFDGCRCILQVNKMRNQSARGNCHNPSQHSTQAPIQHDLGILHQNEHTRSGTRIGKRLIFFGTFVCQNIKTAKNNNARKKRCQSDRKLDDQLQYREVYLSSFGMVQLFKNLIRKARILL